MTIGIFTYGTRGDLQPYIAIGLALQQRGHRVTISATEDFREFVMEYGLSFEPLWGNAEQMMNGPEGQRILKSESPLKLMKYYFKVLHDNRAALRTSYYNAISKVDVVIANAMTLPIVAAIAEHQQKKLLLTYFMPPMVPTGEFPLGDLDFFDFPWYNRLTYRIAQTVFWNLTKKDVNEYRTELGLPALKENLLRDLDRRRIPDLYCISRHLIPQPKDWESQHKIVGFVNIPPQHRHANSAEALSDELMQWISNGTAPIYLGFGSNGIGNPEKFIHIISTLLERTNHRILFCTGWSRFPALPGNKNLFVTKYVNHEAVLPHCQLGIFHGGAGTLATMLRQQLPVIIVSFYTDQPTWGKLVERHRLGRHIPQKKLKYENLLAAIKYCQNPLIRQNAAAMGQKIIEENGPGNSIAEIEKYLHQEI